MIILLSSILVNVLVVRICALLSSGMALLFSIVEFRSEHE